jgi:hypothetical protein
MMAALPPHVGGMVGRAGRFFGIRGMRNAVFGLVLAALAAALAGTPAQAADPVFPPNSRIGLSPPPGFVPSSKFPGFENPQANAAILLVELPAEAFPEIEKGFTDEALKTRGLTVETREAVELASGRAILIIGQHAAGDQKRREMIFAATLTGVTAIISVQIPEESRAAISEAEVRAALKTAVARASVPEAEKLAALPYRLSELSGFRVIRGGPDGTALLTDGPEDTVAAVAQPFVLIGLAPGEPPKPEERDTFARRAFSSIPGIKEIRILRAEPLRIGNQPGFEILAEAKDQSSSTEVTTVQWLRFGAGGYVQMFAIGRRGAWAELFPRLRAIRDGLEFR